MNKIKISFNKYSINDLTKYFYFISILFLMISFTQKTHASTMAKIVDTPESASYTSSYSVAEKPNSKPKKKKSIKKRKDNNTSPHTDSQTESPTPAPVTQTRIQPLSVSASFTVKVNELGTFDFKTKQGTWVSGAQVRIRNNQTSANTPSYNNTLYTNQNGEAVFSNVVPNGAYDVSVSKSGCTSINNKTYGIPNNIPDYTQYIALDCGAHSSTPTSSTGSQDTGTTSIKGALGIEITEFNLNSGDEQAYVNTNITLNYKASGGVIPSHYKAEECSAFDAPYIKWKQLPSTGLPIIKIPTPRRSTVCFQLKKILRPGQEIISNKVSDKIMVLAGSGSSSTVNAGSTSQPVTGGTAASSCPQSLAAPSIRGPLNGATCVQDGNYPGAWFRWGSVSDVGGRYPYHIHFYRVGISQCSEDGSNDNPPDCWMYDQYTSRTVTEHFFNLEEGTKYRWKVRGVCTDQQGNTVLGQWSNTQEFETRPVIQSLTPTSPINGANVTAPQGVANVAVELRWNEPPCGPHNYVVQVFESGSDNAIRTVQIASDNFVTVYMPKGKSYDWWVKMTGPRDTTNYSTKRSFSTQ